MIRLGEKQVLEVVRKKEFGVYVAEPDAHEESILLPSKSVPEGCKIGDQLEVFVYRDSSDRLIATTAEPKLVIGQIASLQVKEVTKIGAFLDWGLEKDLLLPYKEQSCAVEAGHSYLVALYIDKSGRLCATMKIYPYLRTDHDYKKDDMVRGILYQVNDEVGAFIAVDGCYHGMIPKKNYHGGHRIGSEVETRVVNVRMDGKMELAFGYKTYIQMDVDADTIMKLLQSYGGVLPFTEKAVPQVIERETGMSKAAFKRAVGRLLKIGKIEITNGVIRQKQGSSEAD